jgi:hypothetical protein
MPALHIPLCNYASLSALLDLGVHPERPACSAIQNTFLITELLRDARKNREILAKIIAIAPDIVNFSIWTDTFTLMTVMGLAHLDQRYDWQTAAKFLVRHGADINETTLSGSTVLDEYHSAIHEAGLRELGALRSRELNRGAEY